MKKIISVLLLMCFLLSSIAFAESATSQLQEMYAQAELLMATGDYAGAATKFEAMGAYSDASQMAMYCKAVAAAETLGMYDVAIEAFKNLGDFKDSKQMATYYDGRKSQTDADNLIVEDITAISDWDLEMAEEAYSIAKGKYVELTLFKDCLTRINDCNASLERILVEKEARIENKYEEACDLENDGRFADAIDVFKTIIKYKDSRAHIYSDYYSKPAVNSINDVYIHDDVRLLMSMKEVGDFEKKAGHNYQHWSSIKSQEHYYVDNVHIDGLSEIQNISFYFNNKNELFKTVYSFGQYNKENTVTKSYAWKAYQRSNDYLSNIYGNATFEGKDNFFILPTSMNNIDIGVPNDKFSKEQHLEMPSYQTWIVPLTDGSVLCIISSVEVFSSGGKWTHEVHFTLYDKSVVDKAIADNL